MVVELVKYGGNQRFAFFHKLFTAIWMKDEWIDDWVKSIFIPIPKEGDTLLCSSNRNINLICHCSKTLRKLTSNRMKLKMGGNIKETQAGFRSGTGTRNQVLILKFIFEKNREYSRNIFLCFTDYSKAFDTISHELL